ncbi:hypothetical protein FCULG_00012106 [Fusarium culmorum]|uniref:Uncharacterized protein n=1 Tax=Fusarium culmorum TaxID=5516 RepID=A0A2T4GFJ7_FUSCU|nr:hypothetical protein FCULG_00012106 [Fusarium culmorum]
MGSDKLTPALMTGSFFLGLSLALGHHLYYFCLDGKIVKSQSQQQWLLRVGTGLAFLVRAFLSAAVGIAYTQILWRSLRSKPITIRGVNSLFDVIHNPFEFFTWELWTAAPLIAVVAVIAWALPLVAIITPATLTVTLSSQPNITDVDTRLSIPDYSKADTFGIWTDIRGGDYLVPSTYVSRLLLSVASLGSILTVPAPFPNSSYALDFYGPTLSCDIPKNRNFSEQVKNFIFSSSWPDAYAFVGFVPTYGRGPVYNFDDTEENYAYMGLRSALNSSLVTTAAAAKLYVAVPDGLRFNGDTYWANKTIECQLYNSSFAINFTFNNGQQNIRYKSKQLNRVATLDPSTSHKMDRNYRRATEAYLSLMGAMGQFLLGRLTTYTNGSPVSAQTQIRSSVLMDTNEMYNLKEGRPESMIGNISMSDALEDLFTNFTISLFSHPRFLQNSSAATNLPVTYSTAQNAFSYEPRNLLAAYGVGLLLAWAIVIVGLLCIKSASASYGSSFSTILRTTRNPDIDKIVPAAETTGAEPLSKHLSNVRLVLRRQDVGPEGGDDEKMTCFTVDSKTHEMKRDQTHDPAESLLQEEKMMIHTGKRFESSITDNESLWERNGDLSLEIFNYRQDRRGD